MIRIPFRKTLAVAATSAAAFAGLLLGAPGVAHASGQQVRLAPVSNPFLYLDVQGGSHGDGAPIIQWTLSGDNQLFTLQPSGGYFELVDKASGKCITTDGVAGNQVYQWNCHGTANQLWDTSLVANNLIGYSIRNVSSNLYLEVAGNSGARGAAIDTWYWNGGNNQFFTGTGS
ncbi:RICIN domain-containing protein [Actinoplanes sp. KI2]|uniref:RICIN domain-containing protein n=1 Tax=Actinoplanes sp. KI2 TaxID=2983315 RepID=UPI0021D60967|nr:RICIN domain-containing protein [Actinoplanes sp. KI2]MCU7724396.1 RICIN domain-containing protein [Actinoplanes sp. KI2]